jgi:hypothetical protein
MLHRMRALKRLAGLQSESRACAKEHRRLSGSRSRWGQSTAVIDDQETSESKVGKVRGQILAPEWMGIGSIAWFANAKLIVTHLRAMRGSLEARRIAANPW